MDLIVNRQLDRQEELAIYELTLKKQRSKKSTLSEKHAAAMQLLAEELFQERKELRCLDEKGQRLISSKRQDQLLCRCHSAGSVVQSTGSKRILPLPSSNNDNIKAIENPHEEEEEHQSSDHNLVSATNEAKKPKELQRQSSTSTIATSSTSSSAASTSSALSSSSSSSSPTPSQLMMQLHHCPSSASSLQQRQAEARRKRSVAMANLPAKSISFISTGSSAGSTSGVISDEASIKLNRLRLDQLNNELERRLHQYEYLVAQEKAILGVYNMNLFTNEGVNNFHRFEVHQQKLQSSQSCSSIQLGQSKRF